MGAGGSLLGFGILILIYIWSMVFDTYASFCRNWEIISVKAEKQLRIVRWILFDDAGAWAHSGD